VEQEIAGGLQAAQRRLAIDPTRRELQEVERALRTERGR